MVDTSRCVDGVVSSYLDTLLADSATVETDWDSLLTQATSVPHDKVKPVSLVCHSSSLRPGMALVPLQPCGDSRPQGLPLQLLDSLSLLRQLPHGTRLQQQVLQSCGQLILRLDLCG